MEIQKYNKFIKLNFNLKNEIFSFLQPKFIIDNVFLVCSCFLFAVKNLKWLILIKKEEYRDFLSNKRHKFPEMQDLMKYFIKKGESEIYSYYICLCLSIKKYRNIEELKLKLNKTFKEHEKISIYLKDFIVYSDNIKKLDLSYNKIGLNKLIMRYLNEALKINTTIDSINLSFNDLGLNELNMFNYERNSSRFILYPIILDKLSIYSVNIKEILQMNNSIQQLYLNNNNLGKNIQNMLYLSEALKLNKKIVVLDISFNNLADNTKNFFYLKEALEINNSIQQLILAFNYIGFTRQASQYLSEALQINKSIKNLNLSSNYLNNNEKCIIYLTDALKINKTLQELFLVIMIWKMVAYII